MLFDQGALFLPTGIACAALAAVMVVVWSSARDDKHLPLWTLGGVFIAAGTLGFPLSNRISWQNVDAASYTLDLVGFTLAYAAAHQFHADRIPWRKAPIYAGLALLAVLTPFSFRLSGLGTIGFNFASATLLSMTAFRYWRARKEAPASLVSLSVLYALLALSFVICGLWLLPSSALVLRAPPDNFAEQLNAAVCLVGVTGIGGLSLCLNQARAARRYRRDAQTDQLTGLLNRRALFENCQQQSLDAEAALVLFDLDRFKAINDRYGHAVGDEALQRFARVLREMANDHDLCARMGGEEFVLVMPSTNLETAMSRAERVRAQIANEMISTEAGDFAMTVSAGVALAAGGSSLDALLLQADNALYEAKTRGRDRVVAPPVRLVA